MNRASGVIERQHTPARGVRRRAEAEYMEMPGLKLTAAQASRLWAPDATASVTLLSRWWRPACSSARGTARTCCCRRAGPGARVEPSPVVHFGSAAYNMAMSHVVDLNRRPADRPRVGAGHVNAHRLPVAPAMRVKQILPIAKTQALPPRTTVRSKSCRLGPSTWWSPNPDEVNICGVASGNRRTMPAAGATSSTSSSPARTATSRNGEYSRWSIASASAATSSSDRARISSGTMPPRLRGGRCGSASGGFTLRSAMARPISLQAIHVPSEAGSVGAMTRRPPAWVRAGGRAVGRVRCSSRLLTRRRR